MNMRASLGIEIRRLRRQRGWTQEELAHRAGLQQREISHIENARHDITLRTLYRLADAFGVAPARLIAGVRLEG